MGIRVPTVVISPWISPKTLIHEPKSGGPHFDATSVIATSNKIFGIQGHLTARDAWTGTFEDIFTKVCPHFCIFLTAKLEAPREDCPKELEVDLPRFTVEDLMRQHSLPLNDHLELQVQFYCQVNELGADCGKDIHNQYEASVFLEREAKLFMSR